MRLLTKQAYRTHRNVCVAKMQNVSLGSSRSLEKTTSDNGDPEINLHMKEKDLEISNQISIMVYRFIHHLTS